MARREAGVSRHRAAACLVAASAALALALAGAAVAPAARDVSSPGRAGVDNEILVGFRAGVSEAQRAAALAEAGTSRRRSFVRIRGALTLAQPGRRADALARLRADPRVRYAEPNTLVRAIDHGGVPNDPSFHDLWGLHNFGQAVGGIAGAPDADIDAPEAWAAGSGGPVAVAVIDTGVDFGHTDLGGGGGAAPMWTNEGEMTCSDCHENGVDDDDNGYVDDWRGWDFANNDNNPFDDNGHGTHVAGTIGARADNGVGVAGVARNVRLMALKFLGADGVGTTADAIAALSYAAAADVRVTNNSWGNDAFSQALADAISAADAAGVLFVAAAGNNFSNNDVTPNYPSSYNHPNILAVAATDASDARAWFSNHGVRSVDIGAPGTNILSTAPGNAYRFADGTSMAAPHVSGAAALAASLHPTATAVGLKALLLRRADPRPGLAGVVRSGARLNVGAAAGCSGTPQVWLEAPGPGFEADVAQPLAVSAIATRCGAPVGVAVSATVNGAPLELVPRGDGLFTGTFTPTASGAIAISVSASAGGVTDTQTVSGGAVQTYSIQPGGPAVTVTTTFAGENAEVRFDGVAGRRVALRLSGVTIGTSTCCGAMVSIRRPDGTNLAAPAYFGRNGSFVDTRTLPATGVYTIFVDPQSSATGSATLTLYDVPPDTVGSITPGGTDVGVLVVSPGQNARLSFDGTAGRRVSMRVWGVSMGSSTCCGAMVSILNPNGSRLVAPTYVGTSGLWVDVKTLPATGAYTVLIDPQTTVTGSAAFTLYDVPPNVGGTLTPGGPSLAVTTTTPGQNAQPVFAGTAGRRISLRITGVTIGTSTCCSASVSIRRPDGATLVSATSFGRNGGFVDLKTLPLTGNYTVVVDPDTTSVGSATLTLYDVPPDASGSVVVGAAAHTLTMATPGQNGFVLFTGAAGTSVTVVLSGVTIGTSTCCAAKFWIVRPDGATVVSATSFGSSGKTYTLTLPLSGTYPIILDPAGASTGSVTVAVR